MSWRINTRMSGVQKQPSDNVSVVLSVGAPPVTPAPVVTVHGVPLLTSGVHPALRRERYRVPTRARERALHVIF